MMTDHMTDPRPDKWRWVVVVAAFFALFVNGSMGYITGVMHVALLETGLYGVVELAWLGALFNCMFALTGPAASLVISLFSCRVCVVLSGVTCLLGFSLSSIVTDIRLLFITYGFVAGFGRGLTYTGSLVILGYYFPKDSSLVTGLSIAGVGIGMFVHPRTSQFLIDYYGLEGAFRMIGAVTFHSCLCGFLMRPSKFERERKRILKMEKSNNRSKKKNPLVNIGSTFMKVVIKNVSFVFVVLAVILFSVGFASVFILLPDFYHKNGSTVQEAALASSLTGLGGFLSRILIGIGANDEKIGKMLFFSGSNGIIGIVTMFISTFVMTSPGRYVYAFLVGTYTGGIFSILSPITLERVGVDNFAFAVGIMMFNCGAGCLVGPPLAVLIWEASGDYYKAFSFASVAFIGASVCGLMSEVFKQPLETDQLPPEKPLLTINIDPPDDDDDKVNVIKD